MKHNILISVGFETTKAEMEAIESVFSTDFVVEIQPNIKRLSADSLPLIIEFTIAAIASGVLYDGIKSALIILKEKLSNGFSERASVAKIKYKKEIYIFSSERIVKQSIEKEISFSSVEDFISHLESNEK